MILTFKSTAVNSVKTVNLWMLKRKARRPDSYRRRPTGMFTVSRPVRSYPTRHVYPTTLMCYTIIHVEAENTQCDQLKFTFVKLLRTNSNRILLSIDNQMLLFERRALWSTVFFLLNCLPNDRTDFQRRKFRSRVKRARLLVRLAYSYVPFSGVAGHFLSRKALDLRGRQVFAAKVIIHLFFLSYTRYAFNNGSRVV